MRRLFWFCGCSLMPGLTGMTGCLAPSENLEGVLERHARAVELLPQEEERWLGPGASEVPGETAQDGLDAGELMLESARSIALQANPDVHAAQARLEMAVARVGEARARYFPNLVLSHASTRTFLTPASRNRLATALQPSPFLPTDTEVIAVTTLLNALRRPFLSRGDGDTNSFSEHSTSLTTSWTLFDGFVREAQLMAAKHVQRASMHSLADVQRVIVRSVEGAYYQVQLAREQLRIARAAEAFSREQYEETRKLHAAGRASMADVDNFRVRMLAAQANLSAAEGLRQTGRVVLAELMGIEGSELPPDLELSPLEEETERELQVPDPALLIDDALKARPDLLELENLLMSEDERVRAVLGLYQPVLLMSGTWGYDRVSNVAYETDDQSSAAVIELRWELLDGGARQSRVRAAESARGETAATLARKRLAVESEVRQAIIDVINTQNQIRLQRENLITATENRRVVRAGYLAGKETLTRLNEAQRDFINSDADLALARIRLRLAWSDLRAATGQSP